MARTNPPFMTGVPELLVLKLLAGNELYGYEIVKRIRVATGEVIRLGEGVVYPALHALEKAGALSARRLKVGGRERVYYRLTPRGEQRLAKLTGDWRRVQNGIEAAMQASPGAS